MMSEIKCPRHGETLEIHRKLLQYHGISVHSVIGICPQCRMVYVNRMIFPSCQTFEIDGTMYEYLPALNKAYPPQQIDNMVAQNQKPIQSGKKKKKEEVRVQKNQPKEAPQNAEPRTETIYPDDGVCPVASKVQLTTSLPLLCPYDGGIIETISAVAFEVDGYRMKTKAVFCRKCQTVFLTNTQFDQIRQQVSVLKKAQTGATRPRSNSPVYDSEGKTFRQIPVLRKNQNWCPFCQASFQRMVRMPCRFYRKDGTAETIKLMLQKCDQCGAVFADIDVIARLGQQKLGYQTVSPNMYPDARSMMEEATGTRKSPAAASAPISTRSVPPAAPPKREPQVRSNPAPVMKQQEPVQETHRMLSISRIPILRAGSPICPYCKKSMKSTTAVKYPSYSHFGGITVRFVRLWECPRCCAVYAMEQQMADLRRWNRGYQFETISVSQYNSATKLMAAAHRTAEQDQIAQESLPYASYGNKLENISQGNNVVQVYARKCHCQKCANRYQRDTMENRTALVNTVKGHTVKINVMYCKGCGQYFVSLAALETYKQLYGGLLAEFQFTSDVTAEECSRYNFAPDSILSRCGYTVKSGVSEQYRQSILAYLLDSGKARKYEIIEKINSFIRIRERNPVYAGACERWRADIQFVSNYQIDHQKFVQGLVFKPGR